jgi:hypothetical protein
LYELSKNELSEGATLYVATDETDKSFFEPFKQKYDVVFLNDFMHVIPDLNTNYYGMIDQLVSYKSRVFYGTWWSTLSGYVNRMRGYYITKHKLEGWQDGTMKSWYFTPEERVSIFPRIILFRTPYRCFQSNYSQCALSNYLSMASAAPDENLHTSAQTYLLQGVCNCLA